MASSLPSNLPKHMACVDALLKLQVERFHQRVLPIAPIEAPSVAVLPIASSVACVDATPSPPPSTLSIRCLAKRVEPGRPAHFLLAPRENVSRVHISVLAALASVALVEAVLVAPSDDSAKSDVAEAAELLPLTYEPDALRGGVRVCFLTPAIIAQGARIVIRAASIAGSAVAYNESHAHVTVGFNHARASRGAVYDAAQDGDVDVLVQLLQDGASTEEYANVSMLSDVCSRGP
jgi:hypothetical protein